MLNSEIFAITLGVIPTAILFAFSHRLNKKPFFLFSLIISVCLAIIALVYHDVPSLQMARDSAAVFAVMPLLFILTYSLLRKLFLILFACEPINVAYNQSSFAYRKFIFPDYIFTFSIVLIPILCSSYFLKYYLHYIVHHIKYY